MQNSSLTRQLETYAVFLNVVLIKLLDALTRGLGRHVLNIWIQSLAKALESPHYISHWPDSIPRGLPPCVPQFFSVQDNGRSWPAMIMSQDRLELAAASIRQRNALLKTEEVFENAIETSLEQDQVVLTYLEKINEELRKLERRLEDQGSDCDDWTEADKAARDRMDLLHSEQDQIEYDRLNRERERAVWRHAVLEQYRNAMLTQTEVDKPLQDHLREQGLMNFNMDHFFDMWIKLPAQYRQTRHLQKSFEDYKVAVEIYRGQHEYTNEQIWEAFFNQDEGQFEAFCAYEDAKIELDLATRRNERLNQDLMAMEEGYRTARLLGRDMPTP